ncbi:uncharacterized protein BO80DRAFT_428067 [Aspergillus ibericus CBS 121593]|uniref:Uncharacterized protein n=1 Tax=Aspergillus ibericus CBS 121593 TaxID=1448316 RepID=A0A395GRK4_9EURO|nr:hypothetical protein BO80DRAFT_428067 [Aspergillus ibericus CBS 121593]RAK97598.1 hypothetical protein BO80DRAFT_428067 [Aspergillus ibericus CBS 121593]
MVSRPWLASLLLPDLSWAPHPSHPNLRGQGARVVHIPSAIEAHESHAMKPSTFWAPRIGDIHPARCKPWRHSCMASDVPNCHRRAFIDGTGQEGSGRGTRLESR